MSKPERYFCQIHAPTKPISLKCGLCDEVGTDGYYFYTSSTRIDRNDSCIRICHECIYTIESAMRSFNDPCRCCADGGVTNV